MNRIYELSFWILYLVSILFVINRLDLYVRPIGFFVFIALAVTVLAVHIYKDNSKPYWAILKIVVIALTLQWSVLCMYSMSYVGSDPLYHEVLIDKIVSPDKSILMIDYWGSHVFHYIVAIPSQLIGSKLATMIFVGLPYIIGIIIGVYKIGKLLFTEKIGLIGALFFSVSSLFIFFGTEIIPSSLALVFMIWALYLILTVANSDNKMQYWKYLLIGLLLVAMLFTNSIITLLFGILLGLLFIGSLIFKDKNNWGYYLIIIIIFGLVVLAIWHYGTGQTKVILRVWSNDLTIISSGKEIPMGLYWQGEANVLTLVKSTYDSLVASMNEYRENIPLIEFIIKKAGIFIYGGLAGIGVIYYFIKDRVNKTTLVFVFAGLVVMIANVISGFLSANFFLSRHTLLTTVLIAPMIGYFLLKPPFNDKVRTILIAVIVFAFTFLSIISPLANIDNDSMTPKLMTRQVFTNEEMIGIDELCTKYNGYAFSDWFAGYYIYHMIKVNDNWTVSGSIDMSGLLHLRNFTGIDNDAIVILRKEVIDNPVIVLQQAYKYDYDITEVLDQQGFTKVYDNGDIMGYKKK